MYQSHTCFSSTNQPVARRGSKRQEISENVARTLLVEHGLKLFNIMLDCAYNHPDLEVKARMADRLLKQILLHPKAGETNQDDYQKVSFALLDFIKVLHGKISPETLDLMLSALTELEEKTAKEEHIRAEFA